MTKSFQLESKAAESKSNMEECNDESSCFKEQYDKILHSSAFDVVNAACSNFINCMIILFVLIMTDNLHIMSVLTS